MFRNIYMAIVLTYTKSAESRVANKSTELGLNDIGLSRYGIISRSVENLRKEFEEADLIRANNAVRTPEKPNLYTLHCFFTLKILHKRYLCNIASL